MEPDFFRTCIISPTIILEASLAKDRVYELHDVCCKLRSLQWATIQRDNLGLVQWWWENRKWRLWGYGVYTTIDLWTRVYDETFRGKVAVLVKKSWVVYFHNWKPFQVSPCTRICLSYQQRYSNLYLTITWLPLLPRYILITDDYIAIKYWVGGSIFNLRVLKTI